VDPLLDRGVLFGNPDRTQLRVSPDGVWTSFLAPVDGVLEVWVAPASAPSEARVITRDRGRGISFHGWVPSAARVLYLQDGAGDENWRVFAVDPRGGDAVALTPVGAAARIAGTSPERPNEILVLLNDRDERLHDPVVVDVLTGATTRLLENPGFAGFVCTSQFEVRRAVAMAPDGGMTVHRPDGANWIEVGHIASADALTTHPLAYDAEGRTLYWLDASGRDTAALVAEDETTGARTVLAEDARADVADWLVHPRTERPQVAYSVYDTRVEHVLDPAIAPHLAKIRAARDGEIQIVSRSLDDRLWAVVWEAETGSATYGLYDTVAGEARVLFHQRTALEGLPLTPRRPVVILARDGLSLVSYLSLPRWLDRGGRPDKPVPLALVVHGGPWARDEPGYDPLHQLLANRGYAVLSVNFRGSTGFGKGFVNAGDREWAGRMHDDLLDAVAWAVRERITTSDKVAIVGGSYGGYAALVGLTFTPEVFACAVDIVGPSNLLTLLGSIPPYWAPMKTVFTVRVGDDSTEEGRAELLAKSPLTRAHTIVRPLLIAQGANDPRVKQAESDQIVAALRENGIPVRYTLFPDEGHGFVRPENRLAFFAEVEAFLAEHLGGRARPAGEAEAASSMVVI
jgi:dipeptidyl aminopeptidase/acylaminoacyl peptidase